MGFSTAGAFSSNFLQILNNWTCLPLLVISPFAKKNFVDNTLTDQSSILRFIEDNWSLGPLGDGSFDAIAGPLSNMLDFHHPQDTKLFLDPVTGQVVAKDAGQE